MGDHQLILIHPSCGGDMGIKVPADACPLFLREECVIVDIKPKELIARGMPQCPLTQRTHLNQKKHLPVSSCFPLGSTALDLPYEWYRFLQQIVDGD